MSIRLRLAAVVALVSVVLLALGGYLFYEVLDHEMVVSLDARMVVRAKSTERQLAAFKRESASVGAAVGASVGASVGAAARATSLPGSPPSGVASHRSVPEPDGLPVSLPPLYRRLADHQVPILLQIVSPSGKLIDFTGTGERLAPAAVTSSVRPGKRIYLDVASPSSAEGPGPLRILVSGVKGMPGWAIVVGSSLASTNSSLGHVRDDLLIIGLPLAILAAVGAWLLARAALGPVERMRRQAAAISEHDLSARLPVPDTRDEIAALARTMDDLLGRLQGALETQRSFVADAGHELRTPLAILSAELELASRPERSRADLVDAVARAGEETQRLRRMAEDLLLLATADEGALAVHRQPVDLGDLLGEAARGNESRAASQGVAIRLDLPGAGGQVKVDRLRIRQVLDNLIDNALKVAPSGSTIWLRSGYAEVGVAAPVGGRDGSPGWLYIEVTDEGPGFPPAFLPRAFERFKRPDEARARHGGGSGLGLAIVAAIAAAHGGRAEASNGPAGGARVRIVIPPDQAPGS